MNGASCYHGNPPAPPFQKAGCHEVLSPRFSQEGRWSCVIVGVFVVLMLSLIAPAGCRGSAYNFFRLTTPGTLFAIDPDLAIRRIDSHAPDNLWILGKGWGIPPLFFHSNVPGLYDRVDFFYPFGYREESTFQSKLAFTPFFKSRWSKIPPFEGHSRCLTLYHGRSDMGQPYWGVFPFYGYTYRRFGVDRNLFVLFPLYYETTDDDARTIRVLPPIVTYANSPGRSAFKVWPLFGKDAIRNDYYNVFVLWPFFQRIDKYPGTEQASRYTALPFPLYMRQETFYSSSTDLLWPLISFYHHYRSGHRRYSVRPFVTYGTGGGIEELSLFFLYSYKKDYNKGISSTNSDGYVDVGDDEVFTERKMLFVSSIQKRFRKGCLVYAKYKFWPFAEYTWDLAKGSHLKVPEIISLKSDFWDLNLGRFLRFVDFRDTPITRELSLLFGFTGRTEVKTHPHIPLPPRPGDDGWAELMLGSFGKR